MPVCRPTGCSRARVPSSSSNRAQFLAYTSGWVTLCAAVLLPGALAGQASAATLLVPSEYATIQDALDASSSGDIVLVAPGTYSGPGNRDLFVEGDRSVVSESGPEVTIIDCGGSAADPHRGFVNGGLVEGFTIRNGYSPGGVAEPANEEGGGVVLLSESPSLVNCIVEACEAKRGGGISVFDATLAEIENCIVQDCTASQAGGGVYAGTISSSVELYMDQCTIRNCSAETGGGLRFAGSVSGQIDRSLVESNEASGGGGVFFELSTNLTVQNTIIRGNVAETGAGVYLFEPSEMVFDACVVYGNVASAGGGGFRIEGSSTTDIVNTTVTRNTAQRGGGYYGFHGTSNWENSILFGNCADIEGDDGWLETTFTDASFDCCGVDPPDVEGVGTTSFSATVDEAPLFCNPTECSGEPSVAGDYTLRDDSPCLPGASPCGELIGALGEGCAVANVPGSIAEAARVRIAPNPTTRGCEIEFGASVPASAVVGIFDAAGRKVRHLAASGENATRLFRWDGRDDGGSPVPAGIYWVRVAPETDPASFVSGGRIVILR